MEYELIPMALFHKHHVIPKHIGGHNGQTVVLTVEEHAEEHRKLWEEHG